MNREDDQPHKKGKKEDPRGRNCLQITMQVLYTEKEILTEQ